MIILDKIVIFTPKDNLIHCSSNRIKLTRQFHYKNTHIQIYRKFHHQTLKVLISDIFHISAQNIDCGYSLELSH